MRKLLRMYSFQSTLPVWGGTGQPKNTRYPDFISIHPPRVGRDLPRQPMFVHPAWNFNPPSPCGEGRCIVVPTAVSTPFQSTLPVWGGTCMFRRWFCQSKISIHPPRVGRDGRRCFGNAGRVLISIHPPRVGRDFPAMVGGAACYISIHPPRVGRDVEPQRLQWMRFGFQSTLPVWGGTDRTYYFPNIDQISIHPPRVGRDQTDRPKHSDQMHFNPPSPCGEGPAAAGRAVKTTSFQSTLPVWGGTKASEMSLPVLPFQSTLPVWGGTVELLQMLAEQADFNPPSPCGEGRIIRIPDNAVQIFQSTLPVWGGTFILGSHPTHGSISIHPPRVGRD